MKFVKQFLIILAVSFAGEAIHRIVPLPIPASIYGMLLMLAGLCSGIIPHDSVKDAGKFLIDIMTVMFVPTVAGLIVYWDLLKANLLPYAVVTFVTTMIVMVTVGKVTQKLIKAGKKNVQ